jgi:predicted nuclease of restriction endonuclease-like (RecB) superfamily
MTKESDIVKPDRKQFTTFIGSVCSEIEHAQVRLVYAANVQMLFHYWKLGHFILFNQKQLGWGSKVIPKISKAIRDKFPEKKGYSPRNLKYMCQFAKMYPLEILKQMLLSDKELETPPIVKVLSVAKNLNACEIAQEVLVETQLSDNKNNIIGQEAPAQIGQQPVAQFTQEPLAQIQLSDNKSNIIGQEPLAQIAQQPPAQIQLSDNKSNIIGQEALAQIAQPVVQILQEVPAKLQLSDNKNNIIGQEPPAKLYDTKSDKIAQEALAQIKDLPTFLSIITQESLAEIENIVTNAPITKINWASHVILMGSKLPLGIRYWYMKQQIEFGWSSNILDFQIKNGLFQRQIKKHKVNNFTATLPKPQSDLANYLTKDPFMFDLAGIRKAADERDIEEQLVSHVTKYLLEMGSGFAFVARQKHFQIDDSDFFADLILYNIQLHAYVVVELKASKFKPEYIGQLNFYVNVVNDKLKGEQDNRIIGLLLCKGKNEVLARYALEGYSQPMGISDYQLSEAIPDELKSSLPTIEEVEEELKNMFENK